MAIKFYNIRSKETRIAESEPQISAMWASSDHSPNITQGQDFGWRLAPEVVVELKRIKQSAVKLQEIAVTYGVPLDTVDEKLILQYISDQVDAINAPVANDDDYTDEYEQAIKDEELSQREAEISAREAALGITPTTTVSTTGQPFETTTTTTTEAPLSFTKPSQ